MTIIVTNLNIWLKTTELKLHVPVLLWNCPGSRAPRLLLDTHPGEAVSQAHYLTDAQSLITKEVTCYHLPYLLHCTIIHGTWWAVLRATSGAGSLVHGPLADCPAAVQTRRPCAQPQGKPWALPMYRGSHSSTAVAGLCKALNTNYFI